MRSLRAARQLARDSRANLPELVRLQKDRAGKLEVRIHNDSLDRASAAPRLRVSARDRAAESDDRTTLLPGGRGALAARLAGARRRSAASIFSSASISKRLRRSGFWAARASQPVRANCAFIPNLFDERKNVAALFLRRGELGAHAHRQAGQGRDFEKLREYVPGDSYDEIHWKASAKRGHPVTKVFQIERTQEVYVIVDASRLERAREVASGRRRRHDRVWSGSSPRR